MNIHYNWPSAQTTRRLQGRRCKGRPLCVWVEVHFLTCKGEGWLSGAVHPCRCIYRTTSAAMAAFHRQKDGSPHFWQLMHVRVSARGEWNIIKIFLKVWIYIGIYLFILIYIYLYRNIFIYIEIYRIKAKCINQIAVWVLEVGLILSKYIEMYEYILKYIYVYWYTIIYI